MGVVTKPLPRNYVGIDPSTKTGVAVVRISSQDRPVLMKADVLTAGGNGLQRAKDIAWEVRHFLSEYPPHTVLIEGYSFASKFHQMATLVEIGTLIRVRLLEVYDGRVFVVPPTTLKKFATGKGNADKKQLILAVYKRWGFELPDDNECDAACLAVMGAAMSGHYKAITQVQAESLQGVSHCN